MTMLAAGCSSLNTTPQIKYITIDSSCSAFSPIITHGNDYKVMDIRTVRQINAHNDLYDKLCGEKK